MELQNTLGNEEWLKLNEDKINELLPETWTHINNLNGVQLGYKFKHLGIDWRNENEFAEIMIHLEKIGMMFRDGVTIRRNPYNIF